MSEFVTVKAHIYPCMGHYHAVVCSGWRHDATGPLEWQQHFVGDCGAAWDPPADFAGALLALAGALQDAADREMAG